jgi:heme o synthase
MQALPPAQASFHRRLRALSLTAALSLYLLIVLGAVVRVTGSGLGCPDWPLCYGRLIPPFRADALIEYSHRWMAAIASILVVATAVVAWRVARKSGWVLGPSLLAVFALFLQVGLGGATVLLETPAPVVALHLGLALVVLGLQWVVVVTAAHQGPGAGDVRNVAPSPLSRLAGLTLGAVFLLLVTGALVRATGASASCGGWPLCDGVVWPDHPLGRIQMAHRAMALVGGSLVFALTAHVWKTAWTDTAARASSILATFLVGVQIVIGTLTVLQGLAPVLIGLHVATAAAVWSALVIAVASIATSQRPSEAAGEAVAPREPRRRLMAYLALTKPAILLLLLFTTLAGMVVGAGGWPEARLVAWTLLGGAMAAGGASALNQFTDRDSDRLMGRTRSRPIPSGRIQPAQALAFGLLLCAGAFYVLALGVNLLSAVLALAGMVYYVGFYGLVLKRTTPQNIVIGGGAGAVPLLVGWAAGTGSLTMGAFLLFLLVFFWTPAHFWALALVRQADYRRAGIPMLPLVSGEPNTRVQIGLYSTQVVVLTLLIGAVAREGWFYFGSALALGLLLLMHAWLLWRDGSSLRAWRMYRFSSLYLALFFAALMVNALVG